jgi:hypothetical protein
MNIKTSSINKMVCSAILLVTTSVVNAGWNGTGVITGLYIYPNYAVVIQGTTSAGPANCTNDGGWSFFWSDFPAATQQRIMSMLLTARTSKQAIQVAVSDTACGPEGKKKFTGEIIY